MSKPTDLPRRLGEILSPALGKLAGSDEARAYAAWTRAVGDPVARGTRPKAFRRGRLTVECASSVWANELTYLGPQILRRMDEVSPGHPVRRFHFIVGRLDVVQEHAAEGPVEATAPRRAEPVGQDPHARKSKMDHRDQPTAPDVQEAARTRAEGVEDGRLRAAIEAALRRAPDEPPGAPDRGTPSG